ncbi:hypothetical protein HK103_003353 [Boothiomyces macroporosus]|uniref:RRM domain-containing protein n=1 Tax=Boothiomyces macroporosus TaxID=261099 RepID=A0AAD5UI58_9FUNG|nr:hypothetical protein HK103_003353 [Boothiomyces macroporosus]
MFPPNSDQSLIHLIGLNLVVVKNIPPTLSADTLCKYFESFGTILKFHLQKSNRDHNEALLLYHNPKSAEKLLNQNLVGIGGFYVEKCELKRHAYFINRKDIVYSPVSDATFFDEDLTANSSVSEQETKSQVSMNNDCNPLVDSYASLFANSYLFLEKFSDDWGITELIQLVNRKFIVLDRVLGILDFLHVWDYIKKIRTTARNVRLSLESKPAGKPLVDNYLALEQTAKEIIKEAHHIIKKEHQKLE